jgi:hypothetical protein
MHVLGQRAVWPVAVAVAVRLAVWLSLPHTRFASDEDSYYRVGINLLTTGAQDLFWPPLTGWLIASIAWVLDTTDIRWIRLAWIAMDVACVLLVRTLAARVARDLPDGHDRLRFTSVVPLAYALYLPAISFAQFATSEIPALLLLLSALVLFTHGDLTATRSIAAGVALGALSITRPSLLPLVVCLPAALYVGRRARPRAAFALLAVVASAAVIGSVMARNLVLTGTPTIAQNSAYNLYIGNRDLYAEDLDLFHPVATAGQIEFRRQYWSGELLYPSEPPEEMQRAALAWIAEHPEVFARRALGRLARVFAPKTDVLELIGGERAAGIFSPATLVVLAVANLQWVAVLFGGLAGLFVLWRVSPHIGPVFAAAVLGSLPLCLVAISKPRYAFGFEPVLLIAAGFLFTRRRDAFDIMTRRDRIILTACAAFLVWGWTAWLIFAVTSRVGFASGA